MKRILSCMRRAMQEYAMIEKNELLAVGLSGGKDSVMLLYALHLLQYFYPVPYRLHALCIDMGFSGSNYEEIKVFCAKLHIPLTIIHTDIGQIVFDIRKEKNPCSLCSNLKRGALHNAALKLGCHKIAFGHHANDAIETLLLSMLYEAKISTFKPVTFLDRKQITLIRPMIYVWEKEIIYQANKLALPILPKTCPADGHTKRDEIKQLIRTMKKTVPDCEERLLKAIQNKDHLQLWFHLPHNDKDCRGT